MNQTVRTADPTRLDIQAIIEFQLANDLALSMTIVADTYAILTARLLCAKASLAAERFRMANGHFPDSLDRLVPDWLAEVPEDPFDGARLRYSQTDDGVVVYSISDNLVDDGGSFAHGESQYRTLDVGFRLINVENRGVRIIEPSDASGK